MVEQVEVAWEKVKTNMPQDDGGWLVAEITRLCRLYRHAATVGECVVTALDSPSDAERSRRVRIPWEPPRATEKRMRWWKLWKLW